MTSNSEQFHILLNKISKHASSPDDPYCRFLNGINSDALTCQQNPLATISFTDLSDLSGSMISADEESSGVHSEITKLHDVSQILDHNREMKPAIKESIKNFEEASREFIAGSLVALNQNSVLANELDALRRTMKDVEADKNNSEDINDFDSALEEDFQPENLDELVANVEKVQLEIQEAYKKLYDSDILINRLEIENTELNNQLLKIDANLGLITVEDERVDKQSCKCEVI